MCEKSSDRYAEWQALRYATFAAADVVAGDRITARLCIIGSSA
ncbi:MAG TPA: hypothetical protein VEO73_01000 [Gemmatimonadales bacterium]|nr:hypothetical protein [Gemmatimonadales bacterium]